MAAAPDPWAAIKAAYLREGDYAAIATGRDMGVRTLEIIPRIRAWKAEAAEAAKAPPPSTSVVVALPSIDVTATAATVTRDQQRLSAQLRGVLERELEETQAMSSMASSFVDVDHIETLKAKAITGDSKPLVEYLLNATRARKVVVEHVEKLARAINQAIQCERAVWGLDGAVDKGKSQNTVDWNVVLDALRKPVAPLSLPEGVISFEGKLREREGRSSRGS
jgi:hypothetical protein